MKKELKTTKIDDRDCDKRNTDCDSNKEEPVVSHTPTQKKMTFRNIINQNSLMKIKEKISKFQDIIHECVMGS